MSEEGNWHECVVDTDYEINDAFPYPIRKKGSDKVIKESIESNGYVRCWMNGKIYKKHRVIGLQFIDNDDPVHKIEIDHIDNNRANNHISNIRWVSASENCKNRASSNGRKFQFLDELPETAEPLDSYNGYDLDAVFVDYENKKVYLFNGIKWRELSACRSHGNIFYNVRDIENKNIQLYHKVLFV